MSLMLNFYKQTIIFFTFFFISFECFSKTHEVEMRTKLGDEKRVFSQKILNIEVNDTVIWKALDKGHNVEFVSVPKNAKKLKSKKSEDVEYKFTVPGIYLYQCSPHKTIGMIGFIVVGNDKGNLNEIKEIKMFGLSKEVFENLLQKI